mmetsp:Transcript_6609/g.20634  ORF Transcript_6609/g.20634 Transcript_6609/m.20634 type:complete len:152 (+) Transcript_6609:194-649(+)
MTRNPDQQREVILEPFKWLRRSALARELYEFLERPYPEGVTTCVRSLAGAVDDCMDSAVNYYVHERGLDGTSHLVQKVQVDATNDAGVLKLRGEQGVAAKRPLPEYSCVGQYVGDDVEFERLYPNDRSVMHVSYERGPHASSDRIPRPKGR